MKFFIDTANVKDIREAAELGLLDGVTTNPTLLSREDGDPREILRQITKIVEGPVSAEVTALDAQGMVREGLELRKIADNIVMKAGATFASPFVGRLDDISTDGMELIDQICTIYRNYGYETQVLVASIRHPMHVVQAGLLGAHVVTMPPKVIGQLARHPLTDIGLEQFLADWEKVKNRG
jgi:transaldolase